MKSRLQRANEAEYIFDERKRDGYFYLTVRNACIFWPNFAGIPTEKNHFSNKRTFKLSLPEKIAEQLLEDGWNVWKMEPREEGDDPTYSIEIEAKFDHENIEQDPEVHLYTEFNGVKHDTILTRDTVAQLDDEQLMRVDLVLNPWHSDKAKKYYWRCGLLEMHAIAAPPRRSSISGYFDNWMNEPTLNHRE